MPKKKIRCLRYLQDLFDVAGGSAQIAADIKLSQYSVQRWRINGVPQKHWSTLCDLYEIAPIQLYNISEHCRSINNKP